MNSRKIQGADAKPRDEIAVTDSWRPLRTFFIGFRDISNEIATTVLLPRRVVVA
jgi:hypothetical protein